MAGLNPYKNQPKPHDRIRRGLPARRSPADLVLPPLVPRPDGTMDRAQVDHHSRTIEDWTRRLDRKSLERGTSLPTYNNRVAEINQSFSVKPPDDGLFTAIIGVTLDDLP